MELRELKELMRELSEYKEQKETLNEELKIINEKLMKVETIISDTLTENNLDSFKTEVGTAYKVVNTQVTVTDKKALINYLKENGYEDLVSVNAQTLKAFVKSKEEVIPGIETSDYVRLNFRR